MLSSFKYLKKHEGEELVASFSRFSFNLIGLNVKTVLINSLLKGIVHFEINF